MHLLIVPLVLTGIGLAAQQVIANLQQDVRQQQIEAQRAQRAVLERALAEPQAQDEVLQAYLDVMKDLLLEQDLRDSGPDSSARAVANVQTLHTLERVDGVRKRVILRLLADSHLIDADTPLIHLDRAALQEVDAEGMDLSDTDLSRANLEGATLFGANLSGADLSNADLLGADLRGVNLSGAEGITNEELEQQAASLEGATMPNGQKYEDWLTSKDRAEDG